jgi:predicted AlkP superfamily pyrophosphatase or phosphodiesterase
MKISVKQWLGRVVLAPVLVVLALLAGCGTQPPARPPLLVLVSIDGFRPDYLNRGITPVLSRLAREGVLAPQGMQPSFPSLTFPNHYTLVTGLTPGRHGVVANTMLDPTLPGITFKNSDHQTAGDRRWWDDATPIWVSAQRQGLRASTMFWPGTEADIQGVRPADWQPYSKDFKTQQRVDKVLSWLDRPAAQRPDLVTLYFDIVDTEGHHHGPDGPELNLAVAEVDAALGKLVDGLKARGLWATTNLVLVADHGMAPISVSQRLVVTDDIVDVANLDKVDDWGPLIRLEPLPGKDAQVRQALLAPHPHVQCWAKADLPARFDYSQHRRVPPYLCLAETGWVMATRERLARKITDVGAHGFDPADPQMAALFIAEGPAFKPGTQLSKFTNVDVYPLLARLLGIRPEPNQGQLATFSAVLKQP